MKKTILVLLAVAALLAASFSIGEGAVFSLDSPFTSSYTVIITNFNSFGDHAVITYESTDQLGSYFAVLLDADGNPVKSSATFGWYFLFADTQSDGSLIIYGSDTGYFNDWHRIFF